jgi:hypothetical protein
VSDVTASDVTTLVDSLKENSERLGLTWTRRFGTVVNSTIDDVSVDVQMDNATTGTDVTSIDVSKCTSIIGPLVAGQRVVVDAVPPVAKFVVGILGGNANAPRGIVDGTFVQVYANSVAISTGTAMQSGNGVYPNGRAFRVVHESGYLGSVVGNQPQIVLRAGPLSPTGNTWRQMNLPPMTAIAQNHFVDAIFINTSGLAKSGTCAAVIVSGSGTTTEIANSGTGRYIYVEDIGPASKFSTALSL